jgi:hypothetical protein
MIFLSVFSSIYNPQSTECETNNEPSTTREFGESSFAKKSFDVIGVNLTTIYNFQQFFISLFRISSRHIVV